MSYPPPPGFGASSIAPAHVAWGAPHPSLPRPPSVSAQPPPSSYNSAFAAPSSTASAAPGGASYPGGPVGLVSSPQGAPGAVAPFRTRQASGTGSDWSATSSSAVSTHPPPPAGFANVPYGSAFAPTAQHYASNATPSYYGASSQHSSPPQIRNPFPLPGQDHHAGLGRGRGGGRSTDASVDPEMEAQIAQWQSAYVTKDAMDPPTGRPAGRVHHRTSGPGLEGPASASGANAGPLGSRSDLPTSTTATVHPTSLSTVEPEPSAASTTRGTEARPKTVVRTGGGQTWTDQTLLEWDPAHFRLFVGNLAGEVTDDSLLKAFARYPSVQKARVVRDKRTTKSRGYGFVSFSDGDEYFQAAKEMQGKYIGSHPVLLRRSTTEIRPVIPNDRRGKHGKTGRGGHSTAAATATGTDRTGAGVHKKSNKTKGGLRVLG